MNKKIALKIKVKHMAEEARIIRKEEHKTHGDTREWLYLHRINALRPESRATQIAYGFAKGTALKKIEKYPEDIPQSVWARVAKMVSLYSGRNNQEYNEWIGSSVAE